MYFFILQYISYNILYNMYIIQKITDYTQADIKKQQEDKKIKYQSQVNR